MRPATIASTIFVLATCLLRSGDAVTCTADPTVTGCINCSTNPTNAECVAEAAASSSTSTTTTAAPTTTTTSPISSGGKRKIVRVTDLNYSVTRRIRLNPTTSGSTNRSGRSNGRRTTNGNGNRNRSRNSRNNARRGNARNRRGNVRVFVA
ncbi:protein new-glue 3 [Drosophila biarmipes]|uniref:protein new-glue 3 n=1 Tax=Drosophila biarmipes TaxID=125945 RepID=UPI0007E6D755|nr:protein new-glue 3 [Drosophila biarmipes]